MNTNTVIYFAFADSCFVENMIQHFMMFERIELAGGYLSVSEAQKVLAWFENYEQALEEPNCDVMELICILKKKLR